MHKHACTYILHSKCAWLSTITKGSFYNSQHRELLGVFEVAFEGKKNLNPIGFKSPW